MRTADSDRLDRYRLWLVQYDAPWHPESLRAHPPKGRFVGPIIHEDGAVRGDGCVSAEEASTYCDTYNEAMLRDGQRRWVLALPVTVCYEGEPQPGDVVDAVEVNAPGDV